MIIISNKNEKVTRLTLINAKHESRATVNDVTIVESPELELKESVGMLARLESLMSQVKVSTGLQVVDLAAVLDLEDEIADA